MAGSYNNAESTAKKATAYGVLNKPGFGSLGRYPEIMVPHSGALLIVVHKTAFSAIVHTYNMTELAKMCMIDAEG